MIGPQAVGQWIQCCDWILMSHAGIKGCDWPQAVGQWIQCCDWILMSHAGIKGCDWPGPLALGAL